MALDSFGEPVFNDGSAHVMRAQYLGSLVFNVGFFYYGYFALTSLRELLRLPPSNSTRRLLVPYTLILLLINLSFAIFQDVALEQSIVESSRGAINRTSKSICTPGEVLHAFFLMIPIFLNDLLFLYRAGVLVSWQWRVLVVPCMIYLASLAFGIFGLVTFIVWDQCTSQDGTPYRLIVTVALTGCLNVVLGGIIIWRLNRAHRAVQSLTTRNGSSTQLLESRYMRMTKFIAESSLLWIITAFLFVVISVSGFASVQAAAPFFELLFEVAMMLSPALLTYHVATEYTAIAQSSLSSQRTSDIPIDNSSIYVDKRSYV